MSVRSQFDDVAIDQDGNALSNIEVSVYDATTDSLATIYNLRTGGTTKSNAFTTDATGLVQFWAEPGSYDIVWHDLDDPVRISDREITWEAVSGATQGVSLAQLDDVGGELAALAGLTSAANKIPYFTGSGTADLIDFIPWTTWVPTFNNFTKGNATISARYGQIGKLVSFFLNVTLGTTSSMGTSPTFSLPITAVASNAGAGELILVDTGTAVYQGIMVTTNTTTAILRVNNTSSTYLQTSELSSTVPFTWVTGDVFYGGFTYEAA